MNAFDIALLVLLGVLVLVGLAKGLARILIGIGTLLLAFGLAARFHQDLAPRLAGFGWPDELLKLSSYLLIFFGTMLVGGLLAWLTRKMLSAAMLGWADRLAGAALGMVAATLAAALLVLPLVAYSPAGEQALRESRLAPYVAVVADLARVLVPSGMSERYRVRIDGLREYWNGRWQDPVGLEVRTRARGGGVAQGA